MALVNQPSKVGDLEVANLAVSPPAGVLSGQTITISWDDSNTGDLPVQGAWDDQVVVRNVTTGDTLATALVHYDATTDGPLAVGGSLARQYTLKLPDGGAGAGDLEITVTADIGHAAGQWNNSLVNANLRTYTGGGNYPVAPTVLNVGGLDFSLVSYGTTANSLGIIQSPAGSSTYHIATHVVGATAVDTLMNSIYGTLGANIASIEFLAAGGADATFDLVEGTNIRDHYNDGNNNTIAPGTPSATFGSDRLDRQTFTLPAAFASDTLTEIILTTNGGNPQGQAFLAAITVSTVSGPAVFVPLGSGLAAPDDNAATTTVASSLAPYPDLQVDNLRTTPASGSRIGLEPVGRVGRRQRRRRGRQRRPGTTTS